jgi:hypothetical protein
LLNGRSPRGRKSFDQNPFGGLPLNLLIGLYKWLAPNPRISCHHGIHWLQFDLKQLVNSHAKNFIIQDM